MPVDLELNEIIKNNKWYQRFSIEGIETNGLFDWRPYFKNFKNEKIIFKNKSLIDVGPGDGFFSYKFKELGAKVTAYDIINQAERDNYNFGEANIKFDSQGNIRKRNSNNNFNFELINKILNLNIDLIYGNIYELSKIKLKYDIVFCNDVLMHLTDPIKAIYNLKNVSKKYVIIGNPIIDDRLKIRNIKSFISSIGYFFLRKSAISSFLGKSDRNAYWILNKNGFKSLVESAGIKIIDTKIIYPKIEDFFSNRPRMIIFGVINNKF
jgi:2-polyprenyl-3-methyl-5-hydroxy-6-metoxy-1,4-benzoquinol methylase|tara:strand:- start:5015 stop:5812 length:798 start_codon:yes stop_codon:yes gene_type:complete